jgi:hypothetical protein
MPKAKKRGRGSNKNDKEKPLLSVQGILRLDKSFVPRQVLSMFLTISNNRLLKLRTSHNVCIFIVMTC